MHAQTWDWHWGCKGMLEDWIAERRRLKLQALERWSSWELERESHSRLEAYGRYSVARQWYGGQRQLRGIARGLAQRAGQLSREREWRDRLVREEQLRSVALGTGRVREGIGTRTEGPSSGGHGGPGPAAILSASRTFDTAACHHPR